MLVQSVDKQKLAIDIVKTALLAVGIRERPICVQVSSWLNEYGKRVDYSVFVSAEEGKNEEPFYETGKTLVEAVRKAIASIKGKTSAKTVVSVVAPF